MMFRDRTEAGRQLAGALTRFRTLDPVVLALVRGGLPVAYEAAEALDAPLDIVLVRKIGAPSHPELALGAVADGPGPEIVVNEEILPLFGMTEEDARRAAGPPLEEIRRRRELYLRGRPRAEIAGKTAIVIDDGIATGATTRAALHAVRRQNPARLVLAVPVAPPDSLEAMRREADEVVCLQTPEPFFAIGCFYMDFHQIGDDEVIDLLDRARRRFETSSIDAMETPE
jgi:putative phosphoribosyl transferase